MINKNVNYINVNDGVVTLRSMQYEDITNELVSWLCDEEVVKFSRQKLLSHSIQTCRRYLDKFNSTSDMYIKIMRKDNEKPIGTMTVFFDNDRTSADLGIMVGDKNIWGRGYGLRAWNLCINYLFEHKKVKFVTGGCDVENFAMLSVFKKANMIEDLRMKAIPTNGKSFVYYIKLNDLDK